MYIYYEKHKQKIFKNISTFSAGFLCSQIITLLFSSMISINHEKVLDFYPIVKPLYPLFFV